jgi:putative FmdB family regulatory protein
MPLYDYKCQKCGHRFEKIQKFSDGPVRKCPECGGKVEKMISAPAFHFKGSGFYKTDYPSGGGEAKSSSSDDGRSSDVESSARKVENSASGSKDSKASESRASESKPAESKPAKSKSDSGEKKSHKK